MGQSTDAIIAFGFDLGEDVSDIEAFAEAEDHEDGLQGFFDEMIDIKPYKTEGWISFDEDRRIRAEAPVALIRHCSADYPMYFLAVPGTEQRASRGSPVDLEKRLPEISSGQLSAFISWCMKYEIELPRSGPSWHIFSDWG